MEEERRGTLGWHDLPIEVELLILETAVTNDEVTQMVLPFVCQSWLAFRSAWQPPLPAFLVCQRPPRSAGENRQQDG